MAAKKFNIEVGFISPSMFKKIDEIRKAKGYTIASLAKATGISYPTVAAFLDPDRINEALSFEMKAEIISHLGIEIAKEMPIVTDIDSLIKKEVQAEIEKGTKKLKQAS